MARGAGYISFFARCNARAFVLVKINRLVGMNLLGIYDSNASCTPVVFSCSSIALK